MKNLENNVKKMRFGKKYFFKQRMVKMRKKKKKKKEVTRGIRVAMLRWPCAIPNKSNPTCFYLILILIPYFGWFLLVMWTMFLVKIACYWYKTFYNFDMFKNKKKCQ